MRPLQQDAAVSSAPAGPSRAAADGGEIRRNRAAATGDEAADMHELDAGPQRRVIGVERGPGLDQMTQHVNDSRTASAGSRPCRR